MLWNVTPTGPDTFRGFGADGPNGRLFGGQVAGQALAAALAGVPGDRAADSLHARFVRAGRGGEPIDHVVTPVGDRHREVIASQGDRVILMLDVAFGSPVVTPPPSPGGFDPDGWVPSDADAEAAAWLAKLVHWVPFDIRFAGRPAAVAGRRGEKAGGQNLWLRTKSRLPDGPHQHQCALTYVSDLLLVSTALSRHGLAHGRPGVRSASLDHAVWFRPPFRVDEWLLYEQQTSTTGGGRGMCEGRLSDQDGRVTAMVRQEVMLRGGPAPSE